MVELELAFMLVAFASIGFWELGRNRWGLNTKEDRFIAKIFLFAASVSLLMLVLKMSHWI